MKYSNYILETWNSARIVSCDPTVYYLHKLNKKNNLYFTIGSYASPSTPQTLKYSNESFEFSAASIERCTNSKFEHFDSIEQLTEKYFDIFL